VPPVARRLAPVVTRGERETRASETDLCARHGLFHFAQRTLPLLLAAVPTAPHPPTLIVTGATASVRGSARFASFAAGKFAQRGLTQSLAREFGPRGVHVAYAVIDGGIDTPWGKGIVVNNGVEDGKIKPEAVWLPSPWLSFLLTLEGV
jgi:NAD(P)-dependent dehydrogenase (short-subunit alcohol dehydrogenase family)